MRPLQKEIIANTHVLPKIDPATEVEQRVTFLMDYLRTTHAKGYVLGISGGVDSSLAGRLCQIAVERLRKTGYEAKFYAVRLPYHIQKDEADAQIALDFINSDQVITFNIGNAVDAFEQEYHSATNTELSDFTKGNTKARLRMVAQYALGGDQRLLVVGTDQAAENVTGFFTKYGDGGADITPLFGINKRQVRQLLQFLQAPLQVWQKPPTADLLDANPGRLDEDEIGISYEDIDTYLEGGDIATPVAEKIEEIYLRTRHKRTVPVTLYDTWWKNN